MLLADRTALGTLLVILYDHTVPDCPIGNQLRLPGRVTSVTMNHLGRKGWIVMPVVCRPAVVVCMRAISPYVCLLCQGKNLRSNQSTKYADRNPSSAITANPTYMFVTQNTDHAHQMR